MSEKYSCNQNQAKKKSWTESEDEDLVKLVHRHGAQKWTMIAEHLPGNYQSHLGRIGKQCR